MQSICRCKYTYIVHCGSHGLKRPRTKKPLYIVANVSWLITIKGEGFVVWEVWFVVSVSDPNQQDLIRIWISRLVIQAPTWVVVSYPGKTFIHLGNRLDEWVYLWISLEEDVSLSARTQKTQNCVIFIVQITNCNVENGALDQCPWKYVKKDLWFN